MLEEYDYVIIGGGIAGTSCAQRLCSIADSNCRILILSASSLVKSITNLKPVTKFLHSFDVEEKSCGDFSESFKNLTILTKIVSDLDAKNHILKCSDNSEFKYKKLCVCTGGRPKLINENNPYVLGIRDTETVFKFQSKLKSAKQIIIVGNGGIATELVYEIQNCNLIWVIKDSHISHTFFDPHSAKFFEKALNQPKKITQDLERKRQKYTIS
ncbi:pyridine nucleotide-disulfide oxidoreductase domain-containing 1, partial [Brachionus plicatilis]